MTAEQQLERSVLEGKERDELSAIAQAMSLKTTTRTKKADIIDQILDATGVTSGSGRRRTGNGDAEAPGTNGAKPAAPLPGLGRRRGAAETAVRRGRRRTAPTRRRDGQSGRLRGGRPPRLAGTPDRDGEQRRLRTGRLRRAARAGRRRRHRRPGRTGSTSQGNQNNQPATGNRNRNNQGNREQPGQPEPEPEQPERRRRRQPPQPPAPGSRPAGQGGELQGGGQEQPYSGELVEVKGMLDLRDEGYGFLRCDGYLPSSKDVYVSISQARQLRAAPRRLRRGRVPAGVEQREVPGAAAHRHGLGHRPRGGAQPAPLRGPDPAVPRLPAQPRDARATRTT